MEIQDRVMIVTGASSGIGEATARLAAQRGARVVLAARRAERIDAIVDELPGALAVTTDVREPMQVLQLVERTMEQLGRIDVLVNNAGQACTWPVEKIDLDAFRAILDLNVVAPLAMMQAVIPHMRAMGEGAIVNISSGTSRLTLPAVAGYASSKAALNMLSLTARAELAADGIIVSLVSPSRTTTEFHTALRDGEVDFSNSPVRADSPQDVAEVVLETIRSGEAEVLIKAVLMPEGADTRV